MKTQAEAEEYVAKARMALAEVGYGDAWVAPHIENGRWWVAVAKTVPSEVTWQVARVLRRPVPCFGCFWRGQYELNACLDPHADDCGVVS